MNKPIIAVDIDDVLSRTAEGIVRFSNERWAHNATLEDFTEDLATMWQVDVHEAEERWIEFMNSDSFENFQVIPGAKVTLENLKKDFTLIAVTSRRASLLPITTQWLAINYPNVLDQVISAKIHGEGRPNPHKLTKAEVLQQIKADYLIDDQPKHCIGAAGVGIPSVLFGGYPWNAEVEIPGLVTRCDTWQEVAEYFDGRS